MKSYTELKLDFITSIMNVKEDDLTKLENLILETYKAGNKLIFVGNGGSNAIASHMAEDYSKGAGIRAVAFSDSSLLTCLANDYGFDNMFSKAIEIYSDKGDLLIAISSSGKSKNILNAVNTANKKEVNTVTLSGFSESNLLKRLGKLNIYVNSYSYRVVELTHEYLLHSVQEQLQEKIPFVSKNN